MSDPNAPNPYMSDQMWAYMLGQGDYANLDAPIFYPGQLSGMSGLVPMVNPSGTDINASTQANILQDWTQLLFDPALAGMAGSQAFAPGAFDDVVSYETVDDPAYRAMQMYKRAMEQQPNSIEALVIGELQAGGTPSTAYSLIRQLAAKEGDPIADEVRAQLDPLFDFELQQPIEGEYDWTMLRDRIKDITTNYNEAPALGPSGDVYNEEGELVQRGGELVEMMDAEGNPILVRQTTEPSELGEKYAAMGLPNPADQYEVADFMPGGWQEGIENYYGVVQPSVQAALERYLQAVQPTSMGAEQLRGEPPDYVPRQPEPEDEGPEMVAETNVPLAEGQGIPQNRPGAAYEPTTGALGGGQVPSMRDAFTIQDPQQFQRWYEANANSLTDEQRFELINYAQDQGYSGQSPAMRVAWSQVSNALSGDLVEMSSSGSPGASVAAAITADYEPTAGDAAVTQLYRIQDPQEFITYLGKHAAEMDEGQLANIGAYASDQAVSAGDPTVARMWSDIGGQLMRGEYTPPAPAGGTAPKISGGRVGKTARAPTGDQPTPPVNPLTPFGGRLQPEPEPMIPVSEIGGGEFPATPDTSTYLAGRGQVLQPTVNDPARTQRIQQQLIDQAWQQRNADILERTRGGVLQGAQEDPERAARLREDFLYSQGGLPTANRPYGPEVAAAARFLVGQPETGGYQAPPGGYPTLAEAAEAGSPAARRYIEQYGTGPINPPTRPMRQPEAPLGGGAYEQMMNASMVRALMAQAQGRPARNPEAPLGGAGYEQQQAAGRRRIRTGEVTAEQGGAPQSERATGLRTETGERPPPVRTRGGDANRSVLWTGQSRQRANELRRQEFRNAYMGNFNERQRLFGEDYGAAAAQVALAQQRGVTPYQQTLMARRMAVMAMGMPSSGYLPGT